MKVATSDNLENLVVGLRTNGTVNVQEKGYGWNDGKFPEMLSVENIYERHSSIPYNPKVADVLFKAGMIESWDRGFDKIKEECENSNTPLPEYEISERGIMVLCKPGKKYLNLLKKYGYAGKFG